MRKSINSADLVRELRANLGLTQERFAARLGVTLPTINRWENGRATPSPLAIQGLRSLLFEIGDSGRDLLSRFYPDEEDA